MHKPLRFLVLVVVVLASLAPPAYAGDAERKEVALQYDTLSVLSRGDRTPLLNRLPAERLQELWVLHMQRTLDRHPELIPAQRSVFYEAIGLTASGYIRVMRSGSDEQKAAMRGASDEVLARAKTLLPQALIVEAFFELGTPGVSMPSSNLPKPGAGRLQPQWFECTCNNETYNGCGMSGYCIADGWNCIPTSGGCGYLGMYGCNGLCT